MTDSRQTIPASRPRIIAQSVWLLRELMRRAISSQCTQLASALAYTSMLALVPLLVVGFATLALFPAFEVWQTSLQAFIFRSFVPGMGEVVQQHLVAFAGKARALQGLGGAALLVTVLSLMASIETAFNDIWEVRRARPWGKRLLLYWTVLTLGPLLVGVSLVATSIVVSLPLLQHAVSITGVATALLQSLPVLVTWAAFLLAYKAIPNRAVRWRHAVVGGGVAAILFEIAKRLFAVWVTQFPSQQAIYGAFATVPIFLLWIYLSWLIVLLGALFTRCLDSLPVEPDALGERDWRASACYRVWRVLVHLHAAQRDGQALEEDQLLALEPELDGHALAEALHLLAGARWIARDESYRWLLVRDLDDLRLLDLARIAPPTLGPEAQAVTVSVEDQALYAVLTAHREALEAHFECSLASLMSRAAGRA